MDLQKAAQDAATKVMCDKPIEPLLKQIAFEAWEEAIAEARDLGWMHDQARLDTSQRNPYRP